MSRNTLQALQYSNYPTEDHC